MYIGVIVKWETAAGTDGIQKLVIITFLQTTSISKRLI